MFLRKGNVLGTGGRSVLFFGVYRVDFPTTAAAGTKLHGKPLTNNQPFRILRNKLEATFPLPPPPPPSIKTLSTLLDVTVCLQLSHMPFARSIPRDRRRFFIIPNLGQNQHISYYFFL